MNIKTENYLESLIQKRSSFITEMERFAAENDIPIMEPTGMELLLQFLEIQQPKRILEIGTAIGYSAIRMVERIPNCIVYSIERDESRLTIAQENISTLGLEKQINVIYGDALEVVDDVSIHGPFDMLFIDAAKGQYERFFTLYEPYVATNGLIISDNVLFKGMVTGEMDIPSKNTKGLVTKLRAFNEEQMADKRFSTMIYPVGDGVMVSRKKNMDEIGGE
ncbi:O-methyltransferase [Evansella sp. AB-P1]|uniref:O-methyltransferase n=1 Tax=Evansella sp. AB-P1 TaxID=3037653 RepID=UPI00241F6995|nr:O-methyltransferase [Evansella sp. AB-P1]MDG5786479.1 O-methyltransferase [Evansella sp. AB-P1]